MDHPMPHLLIILPVWEVVWVMVGRALVLVGSYWPIGFPYILGWKS